MAIYHCSTKIISGNKGRSSVGASAYRSGEKLTNERDGITHDYTRKKGIVYSEVMLCENALSEWNNREKLWNEVEKIEKSNGQFAREYEIALPKELNLNEQIQLVKNYTGIYFVNDGMCADISIHDKGDGNPHAHIMLTMRPISENGKWENKSEKLYLCKNEKGEEKAFTSNELKNVQSKGWQKQLPYYKNGNVKSKPIYITKFEKENNIKYKDYERVKGKNNPKKLKEDKMNPIVEKWNSKEFLNQCRAGLADEINMSLEQKGIEQRVDHRSYKEQGIEKIPTKHLGVKAHHMEARGKETDRGNINREIHNLNKQIRATQKDIEIHSDMQIQNIHNQIQNMKSLIPQATKEQLHALEKHIDKMDNFMEKIKELRLRENEKINIGEHQYSYSEYHYSQYKNAINDIQKMSLEREKILSNSSVPKENDYGALAKELEDIRKEYIQVNIRIKESEKIENIPRVTRQYEIALNQINHCVGEIETNKKTIAKYQEQKANLGIFKGKEKTRLQESINDLEKNIDYQIGKLKEFGVNDISEVTKVLNQFKEKNQAEKQVLQNFNESKKKLIERADQLKSKYQEIKKSVSNDEKVTVSKLQEKIRKLELREACNNLENFESEIEANIELELKEHEQGHEKIHDANEPGSHRSR